MTLAVVFIWTSADLQVYVCVWILYKLVSLSKQNSLYISYKINYPTRQNWNDWNEIQFGSEFWKYLKITLKLIFDIEALLSRIGSPKLQSVCQKNSKLDSLFKTGWRNTLFYQLYCSSVTLLSSSALSIYLQSSPSAPPPLSNIKLKKCDL